MSAPLAPLSRWNTYSRSRYSRLWDGVVGAWCPSLGITGSRLFDAAPGANWGTLTNMDPATDWVVDDGQLCLDFDGSNDYVNLGRPNQIDGVVDNFTLSIWCKLASVSGLRNMIGKATGLGQFGIMTVGADWSVQVNDGVGLNVSGSTLTTGIWYFLSYTLKSGLVSVYTDGKLVNTSNRTTSLVATDLTIAADVTNGRYFAGQIDDFQFRNRALNASEMWQLYRLGRGGIYEPAYRPACYTETDTGAGGVAKPVLFHSYYMSQGMRP